MIPYIDGFDILTKSPKSFKLLSINIGEQCNEKYCKVLKRGNEYKFYSDEVDESDKLELFGKNINICAIVGKNGSGKSSLLDILYRIANNFGHLLFKDMYIPEVDETVYLPDLYASVKYLYGEYTFTLSCEGNEMRLKLEWKNQYVDSKVWEYNPNENEKKKDDNTLIIGSDENDKRISSIAALSFYTIVTNYSIQSFNFEDYEDEGNWIKSMFHRVDGYTHPIVINPLRNEKGIDIENETELTGYRLSSILLYTTHKNNQFIDGYKLHHIQYHFNPNKYYNKIWEKIDTRNSGVHNADDGFVIIGANSKDDLIKNINLLFVEASHSEGSYTNQILINFFPNLNLNENSDKELISACLYFVCKVLSITKHPKYAVYYKHLSSPVNAILNANASSSIENYLISLKNEFSHVTNKIQQCKNFINNYADIKQKLRDVNKDFNSFSFDDYNVDENVLDSIGAITLNLPPSIFKFEIYLEKVDKDGDETENEEKSIPFGLLSSGERQFAYLMSTYVYHLLNLQSIETAKTSAIEGNGNNGDLNRVAYRMVNLIFDEMELCFHPEYQRTFVQKLIDILINTGLNQYFSFNVILTTHSPFVLSDIPKSNILFFKEGNVVNDEIRVNPFAANVNDILRQSFFLDNGFMGEVAKNWILSLCKNYLFTKEEYNDISLPKYFDDYDWDADKAWKFINMIGDPFVRQQLNDAYFKKTNNKDKRIKLLEEELKRLKG